MDKKEKNSLQDGLYQARMDLEKAEIIMQDVLDDYFENYDNKQRDDDFAIVFGHSQMAIRARIVSEYLFILREKLDEAIDLINLLKE